MKSLVYSQFFVRNIALVFIFVTANLAQSAPLFKPDDEKIVAQGKHLYAEQCARCHGVNLEGEPDWRQPLSDGSFRAPPHDETGHTWHHPDTHLFDVTKNSRADLGPTYKTDMPAFAEILSDQEIIAVLSYIKSTWPESTRKRHDQVNKAWNNAETP